MQSGDVVGHYRIERSLGAGGAGRVYDAFDTKLNRRVALKLLRDGASERLQQEARAASALEHPNIVTIHGFEEHEGRHFVVMELVSGSTLSGRRFSVDEALDVAIQMADALAKAHAAGIIHRDLKPSNVMVTDEGRVKILDFGLAETVAIDVSGEAPTETRAGAIAGTSSYMSPEQAEAKSLDARSDIFAFGSVLYELVTGKAAFRGATDAETMTSVLRDEPSRSRKLTGELERLVRKAVRKDPERRFQSMADLRVALVDAREDAARRAPRRAPIMVLAILLLAAAAWWISTADVDAPLRVRPLTTDGMRKGYPSLSPDGSRVAFAWDGESGDVARIYVAQVDGGEPVRITDGPRDFTPTWSPDGQRIAFMRFSDPIASYEIPALGGEEELLVKGWAAQDFSPDGRYLVVEREEFPRQLALYERASGELESITFPTGDAMADTDPRFSPDGRHLAFTRRHHANNTDLFVLSLADQTLKQLTFENRSIQGLAWSADGSEIIYSSDRAEFRSLWRIRVDGGQPTPIPLGTSPANQPSIVGDRLVYLEDRQDSDIWIGSGPAAFDGAPFARPLLASMRGEGHPAYSPDGERFAFASNRGGAEEVWVADAEGETTRQLTNTGHAHQPVFSPDGRYVAFHSRRDGVSETYWIPIEGGFPRRLPFADSFSPDGEWIYGSFSMDGSAALHKTKLDGGERIAVSERSGWMARASSDGRFLYFNESINPSAVWQLELETGVERKILDFKSFVYWNVWRNSIVYWTEENELSLLDPETLNSRVFLDPPVARRGEGVSVSPGGETILFVARERTRDLVLVENFR